ncbi:MAG TPA: tetratricopeptide repeat protein [Polyangiaceae bacterium]|nr:tetratricopeptide repeat protein [Polyangiaceae bacterium]
MSEPKENEPAEGAEKVDTAASEAASEAESDAVTESAESESPHEGEAPVEKKKKKKRDAAAEPENIRDRNARVRAEAAEKRRARRDREQGSAPRRNLDASEMMDDALARSTHAAAGFLKSHFNKLQWLIVGGLAVWIGYEVYSWRTTRQAEKSTTVLFSALAAETGRVSDEASDTSSGPDTTRRSFKTDEERLKAAKKEYLLASGSTSATSSVLADLGAAGVAYDLGQYKEAQTAYEKVKQHKSFGKDNDIRGRTLEGLGMTLEALKNDEGALKQFRELASMDTASFAALGSYHQARVLKGQGKNEEALKLLEKAGEKLVLLKETPAAIKYLRVAIMELYESLDPKKARELQQKLMPADILKQMEELQSKMNAAKEGLPPGSLPMPMPALPDAPVPPPEAPSENAPAPNLGPLRDPEPAPSGSP